MTLDEALKLEAGDTLNALVAERVMGWEYGSSGDDDDRWMWTRDITGGVTVSRGPGSAGRTAVIPASGMTAKQIAIWRELYPLVDEEKKLPRSKPKVYGVQRETPREARRPAHIPE